MSEMVERVAQAICEASGTIWDGPRGEDDPDFALPKAAYMNMARAAIEAMLPMIEAAYVRGVEWNEENPLGREYRFKAAADYADKATSPTP